MYAIKPTPELKFLVQKKRKMYEEMDKDLEINEDSLLYEQPSPYLVDLIKANEKPKNFIPLSKK